MTGPMMVLRNLSIAMTTLKPTMAHEQANHTTHTNNTKHKTHALGAARSGILNRQGGLVRIVGQDLCGW